MKKFMTLMLGLSLLAGATVSFAQDTTATKKTKKSKKSKKTDSTEKKS
jgi:hypothetical protein